MEASLSFLLKKYILNPWLIKRCIFIRIYNVGAVSPQLMFVCRWYALLLARSVNTQLALRGA
jgi:hypothetical protein